MSVPHIIRGAPDLHFTKNADEITAAVAAIETEYEENGLYHKALDVKIETHEGETIEIRGDVENFIPLRNRRAGLQTHIGEGMTRWQCGDQVGYGLSEYLKQVD